MDNIEEAKQLAERIEKGNLQMKELIEKAEKLNIQNILGGKANTSEPVKDLTPEQQMKQGAMDLFKGTQIEEALKLHG